jgi:hypothetical protein
MERDGRWMWECIDPDTGGVALRSGHTFPTFLECRLDAERHGFYDGSTSR